MKRLEVFANLSVKEEIIRYLESRAGMRYTLIPAVQGKGLDDWKMGTTVWPEENFMLISYLDDEEAKGVIDALTVIKSQFPEEGMRFFTLTVD